VTTISIILIDDDAATDRQQPPAAPVLGNAGCPDAIFIEEQRPRDRTYIRLSMRMAVATLLSAIAALLPVVSTARASAHVSLCVTRAEWDARPTEPEIARIIEARSRRFHPDGQLNQQEGEEVERAFLERLRRTDDKRAE
jgi:hypothetical protein